MVIHRWRVKENAGTTVASAALRCPHLAKQTGPCGHSRGLLDQLNVFSRKIKHNRKDGTGLMVKWLIVQSRSVEKRY